LRVPKRDIRRRVEAQLLVLCSAEAGHSACRDRVREASPSPSSSWATARDARTPFFLGGRARPVPARVGSLMAPDRRHAEMSASCAAPHPPGSIRSAGSSASSGCSNSRSTSTATSAVLLASPLLATSALAGSRTAVCMFAPILSVTRHRTERVLIRRYIQHSAPTTAREPRSCSSMGRRVTR
jgi:hypothetical protein